MPKSLPRIATWFCMAVLLSGCHRPKDSDNSARFYQVRGIVRGFAPDHSTVSIQHEDIPGLMPSMIMPFSVKDQKDMAGLKIGDAISFRMTVTETELSFDQVRKIDPGEVKVVEPTPPLTALDKTAEQLREGNVIPFFSLTNQDGRPVTADTFRGQPLLLTFVFTRCPVPSFCPRISAHFSQLQDAIKADAALAAKAPHLLSITLDPAFDTPAILKKYAGDQDADPQLWTFATGTPAEIDKLTQSFAVPVQPEGSSISHGLATALVAADGRVIKIWRGNSWEPSEVIEKLRRLPK